MRTQDLALRLTALESDSEITAQLYRICYAVDGEDQSAWLDCFTEDGVFQWTPHGECAPVLDVAGRDALGAWFVTHREKNPAGMQTHVLLHPLIERSADAAQVKSTYLSIRAGEAGLGIASVGIYRDTLRRSPDRVWRLKARRAFGFPTQAKFGR